MSISPWSWMQITLALVVRSRCSSANCPGLISSWHHQSEQDGPPPSHPSGGMNNRFGRLTSAYDNPAGTDSEYQVKDRVHHDKFGNGNILRIEGDRLTIAFDKAGEKRVISSFVSLVRKGG